MAIKLWNSGYPATIDTIVTNFPEVLDNADTVSATHTNELAAAIVALQNEVGLPDGSTAGSLFETHRPEPRIAGSGPVVVADSDHNRTILIAGAFTVELDASVPAGTYAYLAPVAGSITLSPTGGSTLSGSTTFPLGSFTLVIKVDATAWSAYSLVNDGLFSNLSGAQTLGVDDLGGVIRASGALTLTIPELGLQLSGETVLVDAREGAVTLATSGTAAILGGDTVIPQGESAVLYHAGGDDWYRVNAASRRSVVDSAIVASVNTNTLVHDSRQDVSSSAGAVTITVSTGQAGDEMQFRVTDITNAISLATSGTTIQYHGKNTIDAVGDFITLVWWSSTEVIATISGTV